MSTLLFMFYTQLFAYYALFNNARTLAQTRHYPIIAVHRNDACTRIKSTDTADLLRFLYITVTGDQNSQFGLR